LIQVIDKVSRWLNKAMIYIAGVMLGAIVILTCSNIFLRVVWVPIKGTFELVGYIGAVAIAFALGYTQIQKGHIAVDILVNRFPVPVQRTLRRINALMLMVLFALVAWQIFGHATTLWKTGEVTETLQIIYFPFTYGVALGCAALALAFLAECLKSFLPHEQEEDRR